MPGAESGGAESGGAESGMVRVRTAIADAVGRLRTAGARDEALAAFVPSRRVLFIEKRATMLPLGRVWRLGVFLLGHDGVLYATGSTTRATDPKHPGFQSVSAETRREYRAAAFRGRFARNDTVNFDAEVIPLDSDSLNGTTGPLYLDGDRALVRWSAGSAASVDFDRYIAERVELLVQPPEGA